MNRLSRTLRSTFSLARVVIPIVLRVCWIALTLELNAVIHLWRGLPAALDETANEWLDRALLNRWPSLYARQLYFFFYGLALVLFLIGWVLSAYTTIFILRLIF